MSDHIVAVQIPLEMIRHLLPQQFQQQNQQGAVPDVPNTPAVTSACAAFYANEFAPFISNIAPKHGWTQEQVATLSTELVLALAAKAVVVDTMSVSLPYKLDLCWHEILLETALYRSFCNDVSRRFLDHTTVSAADSVESKLARVVQLYAIRRTLYGGISPFDAWSWSPDEGDVVVSPVAQRPNKRGKGRSKKRDRVVVEPVVPVVTEDNLLKGTFLLFCKSLQGRTVPFDVSRNMTVGTFKRYLQVKEGITADHQRIIYAGRQLEDARTFEDYNIVIPSTIHLVLRCAGC
jgi:hypothetical protein